jgi:hypothetical protein
MRHNIITKEAAKVIFNKVENSSVPIAIFAKNGTWNATKINTTNFSRQFKRVDEEDDLFFCIYDINARLEYIEDDMASAGVS